jgi:hypothetical protein
MDRLRQRREEVAEAQKKVFDYAKKLEEEARKAMVPLAANLDSQLRQVDSSYSASVDRNEAHNDFWFKGQIIEAANKHDYFADTRTYKAWVRLRIFDDRQASMVISFHAIGTQFVGILGASAFIEFRERGDVQHSIIDGPYVISTDVFEFSYLDNIDSIQERFARWLDETLAMGLDQWRRQL